ncbi:2-dehydro-3-deoxygalactonokinase [Flammeovirga sp. EKP202]|uniref:2-dehydro-3-deoxygalactonokinase n=1 Tax=Flammeovirga sp. EKP202 TaxID=2770592 RepID=UPI00165F2C78|nr:2-dehydro-3-deoxygalactonokinase [Flammeovirga sp. EKP202]MBD0401785.1 2-dehydro-3-deoxygalactonokinase [Flammeovirga sp. EKP202]
MSLPKTFISCDWGTSNFRLRVIDTSTLEVIKEFSSSEGVKEVYQNYIAQQELDKHTFYANFLKEKLKEVTDLAEKTIIVASGMVSSSMGMYELDYTSMPFSSTGDELFSKMVTISEDLSLLIISGVKQGDNVMRGEEIQALGLTAYLEGVEAGVLLLPGTHSKHLTFKENTFHLFDTYMTGEMFDMLSKHSILSNSIAKGPLIENTEKAFREGVRKAMVEGVSKNLFKVRAKSLLENRDKVESYYYLSGLLIGDELSYLKEQDQKVVVAASGLLNCLYQMALEEVIHDRERLLFFDENILEKALLTGQKKILEQQHECV